MDKLKNTKVTLNRETANKLKKLMDVGETYSEVIEKLLKK